MTKKDDFTMTESQLEGNPVGNPANAAGKQEPMKPLELPELGKGAQVQTPGSAVVQQPIVPMQGIDKTMQQHAQEQEKYDMLMRTKPWVLASDLNEAYKNANDVTPAQMMQDIIDYRRENGQEISLPDYYTMLSAMAGHDPNKTAKQEKKEQKRAEWAERLKAIGDVVNHFVQFGRAKSGSPIAQVQPTYDGERAQRLKLAEEQLKRQKFGEWAEMLLKGATADQQRKLENEKYQRELNKIYLEQNSPKSQLEMALKQQQITGAAAKEKREEAQEQRNQETHAKEMELKDSQIARNYREKKSGGKTQSKRRYKLTIGDKAYYSNNRDELVDIYGMAGGSVDQIRKKSKRKTDDYQKIGITLND